MPQPRAADLAQLLVALGHARVEYIVVDGAAAVIHGAPISTQDLDIVPEQSPANLQRLADLLHRLAARYRPVLAGRDIAPTVEHLNGAGQLMLTTDLGPLDVLCRLHDARGFADLFGASETAVFDDVTVRILQLDALIDIKASTGRAKDTLVVPILREVLRQRDVRRRDI